ncbi:hypothetical protein [Fischerella thermalis]|jgi:hypothetical protein|nr:hypothetical protein [Fischerella thermalis]
MNVFWILQPQTTYKTTYNVEPRNCQEIDDAVGKHLIKKDISLL